MMAASDSLGVPLTGMVRARPSPKLRAFRVLQVKAQSFREEGTARNMVDGSLSVLRKRVDKAKMKERLERCYSYGQLGWNYSSEYNPKHRRKREANSGLSEMVALVCGTLSFTVITGTAFICLASLLIHHL